MNLLIPAAGESSRFPGVRPKWLLTHPNGNLMLAESIAGIDPRRFDRIYLTVLDSHLQEFKCRDGLNRQFESLGLADKFEIVALEKPTRSQPETVYETIRRGGIAGPICIKDCDNFFRTAIAPGNFVSVVDLNSIDSVNPRNKSYADVNEKGFITNIAEKKVISSFFCSGAYGFEEAAEYAEQFQALAGLNNLYISHIVYKMIMENRPFKALVCDGYQDWGTLKEWNSFKQGFGTMFVDLDGTLVRNSGEHFEPLWSTTEGIKENIELLREIHAKGRVHIVITTSRKEEYRAATLAQLSKEGIPFHQILFGCNHGKRIVVNDYARTNPFKSCDAVNLARNSGNLRELLEAVLTLDWNIPGCHDPAFKYFSIRF